MKIEFKGAAADEILLKNALERECRERWKHYRFAQENEEYMGEFGLSNAKYIFRSYKKMRDTVIKQCQLEHLKTKAA